MLTQRQKRQSTPNRAPRAAASSCFVAYAIAAICLAVGCASANRRSAMDDSKSSSVDRVAVVQTDPVDAGECVNADLPQTQSTVRQVSASNVDAPEAADATPQNTTDLQLDEQTSTTVSQLRHFEQVALDGNPKLLQLKKQVQAARARTQYVAALPDPRLAANVFGNPIETAAGSQRANLSVSQMIPSLKRLNAEQQQACFKAMALQQVWYQERLRVVADLRAEWSRLYSLNRQLDILRDHSKLIETLIEVANAGVATGRRSAGDVLLATVEYARVEQQVLDLQQQMVATVGEINRLLGLPADTPIEPPRAIAVQLPDANFDQLRQSALLHQPTIELARLQAQASRWGVEVARLQRRPEIGFNATWFAIDDNRPSSAVVDVGEDAWSLGAQVSLPIRDRKYRAREQEAMWRHAASQAAIDDAVIRTEASLLTHWEDALAAQRTMELYESTILPQARQTLEIDQQSYTTGGVEFDRVLSDARTLLTLESEYHRSRGRFATAIARLQQTVGQSI